jgi:alpha-mannosidase
MPLGYAQRTAWFADGYHGGIYGHFPLWNTRFMIDQLKKHSEWKINLEIEPETWDSVKIHDPEGYQLFCDYFAGEGKNGRIEFVNPNYAQPYCYNISGESIIRQFTYGMAKVKEHFPDAVFTTYSCEEPCFTSSLPAILKGFGFKYGVLRNPNTCWGGYTSAFGKELVNWTGPDGTTILSVPRYACEGLVENSTWQTASWTNSNDFIAACFADGIEYPVGMCFQDAGWKGGPWGSQYQPTVYTLWTDYIERVKNKVDPDNWLFTLEDVKPGLVWGAPVLQKLAQEIRTSENLLVTAEKMASLDFLMTGQPWQEEEFAEAWRTLMLSQHHDCWIVPYNRLKSGKTWAEQVSVWTGLTDRMAEKQIDRIFDRLPVGDRKSCIVVFNTLGTSRNERVAVKLHPDTDPLQLRILNLAGEEVGSQITKEGDAFWLHFDATVPGAGFTTYYIGNQKKKEKPIKASFLKDGTLKIDNDYHTLIIDPRRGGAISSWVVKKMGKLQMVEDGELLNDLRGYLYHEGKFYDGSDNEAKVTVVENGDLFVRIKVENQFAGNTYHQYITVSNTPRIDFELEIKWDQAPGIGAYDHENNYRNEDYAKAFYNDAYKLHLRFPFKNMGSRLFKNAPFDVCESRLDNTVYSSWDSIKHNVILNWVDVTDASKKNGVALFCDHTTSYLHTDDLALGLTVQYIGKALWGRNYITHGPTRIKYALLPHAGDWIGADIQAESNYWNEPLVARMVDAPPAEQQRSLLEFQDKGLEVSSIIVKGQDVYVRFFNISGRKNHQISWNCSAERIELVNLNGNITGSLTHDKKNTKIQTDIFIPQFGFQTVKLTKAKMN